MSRRSELPCGEIILCNGKQKCLLGGGEKKACWELIKDDVSCSFHICVDCLLYLSSQENSLFSEKEFCSILEQRKEKGINPSACNLIRLYRS